MTALISALRILVGDVDLGIIVMKAELCKFYLVAVSLAKTYQSD
ncbi:hypothetical protein [Pseudoalteromonas ostreae]|nr:hypothetical protein [Pseudoalteromonas ostreae]